MRRPQSDPRRARSGEAGFSLIETLIAAAVLLLILIGLLPLFDQSRRNLIQGNDATRFSNAATDVSERLLALPFAGFATEITAGDSRVDTDFFLLDGDQWATTVPSGDRAQYTRTTTIRQYNVSGMLDGDEDPYDALENSASLPGQVHFKRFSTEISNPRSGAGGGPVYRIIAIQTF